MVQNVISGITGAAAGAAANEGLKRAFSAQMGLALNPFNAVTFENVNFKQHQFQWKFMPSSPFESTILLQLKRLISTYALPAKSDLTFEFPYTANIEFYPKNSYLYRLKRCFLQSYVFDYAPSQIPAFFRDGAPVEVALSMNFIEIEIWTSNDYGRAPQNAESAERGPPGDTGNTIPPSLTRPPEPRAGDPGSVGTLGEAVIP